MEPLAALGACSSILQIVDFSCKILSKGNQLRTSFAGVLPENAQLEYVTSHLHGLVIKLRQHPAAAQSGGQGLNGMILLCMQTTGELLDVLERLKIQGSKTRWKSFRAAVKSVWRKEKLEEILGRLQMIRDEIEFGVILDLREDLASLSAQQSIRFGNLDQSTKAILRAVLDGQSASAAASNTQFLAVEDMNKKLETLIISENQQTRSEILHELRQQNNMAHNNTGYMPISAPQVPQEPEEEPDIHLMLKFLAIDDRHSAIPEAYKKTFEWIWAHERHYHQPQNTFWQWLTLEQGIYWVSGKAGSGKSTLMKYIYHDNRTLQGLQHWASGFEVVKAGFFFWNSGSAMQKSLLGLLQSIMYEILMQKPNLKEAVFPKNIQKEVSRRWKSRTTDVDTIFTVMDLKQAFSRLLKLQNLKICLFIDGLDEYEGDHQEVAELFQEIMTSPGVKACLSSRPLVAFERSFARSPRLRLQDLTYDDISLYVREKFEDREEILQMSLAQPLEFQQLVEEIIEKASGVFLWVTLAVRSLLEGLTNYDRMSDLRIRLKEIPDDLSQLYWHMLRGIKPAFYFAQAARLLQIMHASYVLNLSLAPQILAFAEDYEIGKPLLQIQDSSYTAWASSQATIMEGRLMSRCRGLLEVRTEPKNWGSSFRSEVHFLHQSVPDFLMQTEVRKSLGEKIAGTFSPHASLLAAYLAEIKNNENGFNPCSEFGERRIELMFSLARKAEDDLGMANVSLVDEMDAILGSSMKKVAPERFSWKTMNLSWAGITAHMGAPRPAAWNDTFVTLCLQKGLIKYVSAKLENGESMHQGPERRPFLGFAIDFKCIDLWAYRLDEPLKILELCRLLLDRGADPNESFRGSTLFESAMYLAAGNEPYRNATFSPQGWFDSDGNPVHSYTALRNHSIWIDIMNLFMDYGADPNAGLVQSQSYVRGAEVILPASRLVASALIPIDRVRGMKLYERLRSLGIEDSIYERPERKPENHLMWKLLPEPDPEEIPYEWTPDLYVCNTLAVIRGLLSRTKHQYFSPHGQYADISADHLFLSLRRKPRSDSPYYNDHIKSWNALKHNWDHQYNNLVRPWNDIPKVEVKPYPDSEDIPKVEVKPYPDSEGMIPVDTGHLDSVFQWSVMSTESFSPFPRYSTPQTNTYNELGSYGGEQQAYHSPSPGMEPRPLSWASSNPQGATESSYTDLYQQPYQPIPQPSALAIAPYLPLSFQSQQSPPVHSSLVPSYQYSPQLSLPSASQTPQPSFASPSRYPQPYYPSPSQTPQPSFASPSQTPVSFYASPSQTPRYYTPQPSYTTPTPMTAGPIQPYSIPSHNSLYQPPGQPPYTSPHLAAPNDHAPVPRPYTLAQRPDTDASLR